jgi:hypothetical protein
MHNSRRKKSKAERSRIAKRAAVSKKENLQHQKNQKRGEDAWSKTIRPSERRYIPVISRKQGINGNRIFHHDGLPDLMAITVTGDLRFYEIKPKKGGKTATKLNPKQANTIRKLLKNPWVEEVNLVRYEKKGKKHFTYEEPIRITLSNIRQFSLKWTIDRALKDNYESCAAGTD